ncbi:MAG: N-acyl homoserine lactonase family protein [Anaerolineae bacterium]
MNIHLISTGQVKITQNWRVGKGSGAMRLVNTLLDRQFSDWLPIYCTVIEHPEGLIVVDTGIPSDANAPIYFPPHMRLVQRAAPFDISPEQEIGAQMRVRGLNPADVRWVVLTHLHQDHDGGLKHFPNAEFLVSRQEWAAGQGLGGRMSGYLNWRWRGLAPRLVDFESGAYYGFDASETLTPDIRLVPTPGHSAGHLSVVVEQDDHTLFIAGDAAYTQDLLIQDRIDGVGPDPEAQHDSHRRIMALAAQVPTVFLPSHDPDAAYRLENRLIVPVAAPAFA